MENKHEIRYNDFVSSHFVQNIKHQMAKNDNIAQELGRIREDLQL